MRSSWQRKGACDVEKLKSRKLWVVLAYFAVIVVMVLVRRPVDEIAQVAGLLKWGVFAYVGAEGGADIARALKS